MAKRTTISIAHRLSTAKKADQILMLNRGRIIEHGNHDELMAKRGFYHKLYRLQNHR
jgi:ATP-binding cassette subfamily B protein